MALSKKFNNKKVGPFIIDKILRPVIYKFELPPNIGIYPVFYQLLLKPTKDKEAGQGGYWRFEKKEPQEFMVKKILGKRGQQYLVKWKGYLYLEAI